LKFNQDRLPYVSVVVTAYNRKQFLLGAINSVLNQSVSREFYEIICIKNFYDTNIDIFLNQNNVVNLVRDGTIGDYLTAAIMASVGEVIAFLDDDDEFFPEKLQSVMDVFRMDEVVLYRNRSISGKNLNGSETPEIKNVDSVVFLKYPYGEDLMNYDIFSNLSRTCVRRSAIAKSLDFIKETITSQDSAVSIAALVSGGVIAIDSKILTFYRVHEGNISILHGEKNLSKYRQWLTELQIPEIRREIEFALKKKVICLVVKLFDLNYHNVYLAVALGFINKKEIVNALILLKKYGRKVRKRDIFLAIDLFLLSFPWYLRNRIKNSRSILPFTRHKMN
jgi:glycosyltransferase involved in cell wall biosynthesis